MLKNAYEKVFQNVSKHLRGFSISFCRGSHFGTLKFKHVQNIYATKQIHALKKIGNDFQEMAVETAACLAGHLVANTQSSLKLQYQVGPFPCHFLTDFNGQL